MPIFGVVVVISILRCHFTPSISRNCMMFVCVADLSVRARVTDRRRDRGETE